MSFDKVLPKLPIGYVEPRFLKAILAVDECLRDIDAIWSVGGDVAVALGGVDIKPEYAELLTDKEGAAKIHSAVATYKPTELKLVEQRSARDAVANGANFPLYIRSYLFEFVVGNVVIRVHGDLQFKVGEWEWGDVIEFDPVEFSIVGEMVAIVPLTFTLELCSSLGWKDKVDLITEALVRTSHHEAGFASPVQD